ncbi:layilin isoform X4 [Misgurnus anguillicaudatus]|uniref:layilin isoform X4 n=1 Tax=Misgurnus anguillicaudatus TaxID=75329 RepID=UPI003CCFB9D6
MEFMKVIGAVLALCFQPGCASKAFNDQRICRRGTEKPCYKIASFQDSRLRVSFEAARQKCRDDAGELLSIETENEQRLVERFVHELKASNGDFWIGLRREQRHKDSGADCSSQYYWLDNSRATFRNWLVTEPSCGREQCVALFYRSSISAGQKELNLFKWMDNNCNFKNNFICKYSDEKHLVSTPADNVTAHTDDTVNIYYILLATVPVMLLLILVVSGVLCFRVMTKRRKEQNIIYAVPGQWVRTTPPKSQNEYQHTDVLKQPVAHLEYMSSDINRPFIFTSASGQDYENVQSSTTQSGFVTNDIYESSSATEAGWVDNDIYGY